MARSMESSNGCPDLSDNALWKKNQLKTFKRWVNMHLKKGGHYVGSLKADLSDGVLLIRLIEELSNKSLQKYNKNPNFRSQKLANVSFALKFLEHEECINLVNIDSSAIVDCNLKLILGLIWHLILHYSITKPNWENIEDKNLCPNLTPSKKLLLWLQKQMPRLQIKNFTTDWVDGRALGYLVHTFVGELCTDWFYWKPEDSVQNIKDTMDFAEKFLNVQKLVKPEYIVNPEIDEQSMITYLSQFPNAKVVSLSQTELAFECWEPPPNPRKVKVYGPGLLKGIVGQPNKFTVDTSRSGSGTLGLCIRGPHDAKITCDSTSHGIWAAEYTATKPGKYFITVKFGDEEIPASPLQVMVENVNFIKPEIVYTKPIDPKTQIVDCGKILATKSCPLTLVNNGNGITEQRFQSPLSLSITGLRQRPHIEKDWNNGTYTASCYPCPGDTLGVIAKLTGVADNSGNFKLHLPLKFKTTLEINVDEQKKSVAVPENGMTIPKSWLRKQIPLDDSVQQSSNISIVEKVSDTCKNKLMPCPKEVARSGYTGPEEFTLTYAMTIHC